MGSKMTLMYIPYADAWGPDQIPGMVVVNSPLIRFLCIICFGNEKSFIIHGIFLIYSGKIYEDVLAYLDT